MLPVLGLWGVECDLLLDEAALTNSSDTGNGGEHDPRARIKFHRLAHGPCWRLLREILLENFVEALNVSHVEEVKLHEHHVAVATTDGLQERA